MMEAAKEVNKFFDYYQLYTTTTQHADKYLNDSNGKQCRFCGKDYKETSFQNVPHIIPELFGRNNITSNFECDVCNQRFQRFDNDAATLVQHNLAILNIKSKRGVPVFQSKKVPGEYPTILSTSGNVRNINFNSNTEDFEYNKEEKIFTLNFRTKNFVPFHVYKTLLKIGISLLSDRDLKENEHYIDVLNHPEPLPRHQIFTVWRYSLKTKYFKVPVATLFKAKTTIFENTQIPEYVLILYTGTMVFQMYLPLSARNFEEHLKGNSLLMELFPSFGMENFEYIKEIVMHRFDLSIINKVSITDTIKLYYEHLDENSVE